jgi:Initiator Replication protein
MNFTVAQKSNFDGFPKAAELIEMTGSEMLTAQDRALLNLLYQRAHDSGRMTDTAAEWEIPLVELRQQLSSHNANDRLRDSLDRLAKVTVQLTYIADRTATAAPEKRVQITGLFDFFDISADELESRPTLRFGLHRKLRAVLEKSGRWGRIKGEIVCTMRCKYAISLYELVQLRANLERSTEIIPIDRFRELLGVPADSYKEGPNFIKRVLEPALLEVNGLSDMEVRVAVNRRHLRAPIESVAITWVRKEGDAFRAAMTERERPKVGRKARLKGQVERLADVLPLVSGRRISC